ncbi:MAG: GNAT family N-acetyltransferase [Clostridia bacterium]|nr:GNAT family N-acetyltransferase [Clostridia bacterium]
MYTVWNDPRHKIVAAERDGRICGFALLNHITRPENPYMYERDYLDIDELCVDETQSRTGVGTAMIDFIKTYAAEQGFSRIELNMWEFNTDALEFYEAAGFKTCRRYLEMYI